MSFFTGIRALFGSSKTIDTVVETAAKGIYNGIDVLAYTEEEKAMARARGVELFLKFTDKAYDQNNIRNVTRRWLAFMVVGPMMICFIGACIAYFFSSNTADFFYKMFNSLVPWGAGILAFYFGPHLINSVRNNH